MTSVTDYVVLQGIDLEDGDNMYCDCPACGREGKFSITRTSTGLLYNCFRDACPTAGHVSADGVGRTRVKGKPRRDATLRPYDGPLRPLRAWEKARFLVKNGLRPEWIETMGRWKWAPEERCYAFPILDPRGFERGVVLRRYDGRAPKSLTRQHTAGPTLSWYTRGDFSRVIVVEDQVSALKMARWCTSVALLGTALSHEGAQEIASMRAGHVTIALDNDAINTAYKLKDWFGLLFSSTDVLQLKKDVKDMTSFEIQEKFGV
jgi:hypothetical protein